jgi:acetoin utilization protein AcuB
MKIRDVMTWNVITVPSDLPIMEAKKILDAHKILRLPIVDRGELVGIVTRDRIDRASPSTATTLSVWELNYLLAKVKVSDIMRKDVITVSPNTTIEAAIAVAQREKVGSTPVVEEGRLVGIVTTNDIFFRVVNPLLGIGEPGVRINVSHCADAHCLIDVMEIVASKGLEIINLHTIRPLEDNAQELSIHLNTENIDELTQELSSKGFNIEITER